MAVGPVNMINGLFVICVCMSAPILKCLVPIS